MLASGDLPQQGFVRQEEVPLAAFLKNRFGSVYSPEALAHAA
jgi:saccharopine dehydrogenase-like NADP-dependent oxidoreductase